MLEKINPPKRVMITNRKKYVLVVMNSGLLKYLVIKIQYIAQSINDTLFSIFLSYINIPV